MPSVLIVDDNLLARQGLKHLLGQVRRGLVFGEAQTSDEAIAFLARRRWSVAVIDVLIPGQGGFPVLRKIRRSYPRCRVVILSAHANREDALQARQLGASGYAGKNSSRPEVLKILRSVLAGKDHFVEAAYEGTGEWPIPLHPPLSPRERDVLLAFVAGKRVGEIAAELDLSIKTISTYKRRILDKLRLKSVADLVRYAIEHKLL
jgi:DNA-binding NarL/FixJ family response regulator